MLKMILTKAVTVQMITVSISGSSNATKPSDAGITDFATLEWILFCSDLKTKLRKEVLRMEELN